MTLITIIFRLGPCSLCSCNIPGVPQAHFQVCFTYEIGSRDYLLMLVTDCFAVHRIEIFKVSISRLIIFKRITPTLTSWKSDLNTSLAALELLSGLARIPIPEQGEQSI